MQEQTEKILSRLHLLKDADAYNKKIMNDAYNIITDLNDKLTHLEKENECLRKQLNLQTVRLPLGS